MFEENEENDLEVAGPAGKKETRREETDGEDARPLMSDVAPSPLSAQPGSESAMTQRPQRGSQASRKRLQRQDDLISDESNPPELDDTV